jgi:diguanylate cyclase (GGDEF)-like protein
MRSLSFIGRRAARVATQTSFILGIAMIAMLWTGIALKFKDQAAGSYRDAVLNNQNLALLFEENVFRSVGEVDHALLYLRHQIDQQRESVDLQAILMNSNVTSEVIDQFAITNARGILRASNRRPTSPPPLNLADREHIRFHLHGSEDKLFVGPPVIGRVSGLWLVPLTRRLTNPDGSLAGVVVASLNPKHFTKFYQSIELGRSGSISLVGLDGYVRSTGGSDGHGRFALGQDISGSRLLNEVLGVDAGTFVDSTPKENRIVTFRRIRNLPLAVSVSVTEKHIYATAYRDALRHSLVGAVLSLIILGVGIKGSRDQLRLRLAKAKLLHSQRLALQKSEHLGLTLDNMGQGIILVTKDLRIPVINRQAVHLLDLPEDFLRSSPNFADLVSFQEARGEYASIAFPEGVSALEYFTQRDTIGGLRTYERTRPNGTVLEVRSTALPDGGFVRTFTDVTRRHEAQEAVVRLASEDALTGLANRRHFREEVEKSVVRLKSAKPFGDDEDQGFALLYMDLDWFKVVNDTLGHWIGDTLLQSVADRLRSTVRTASLIARLGGDEFGILLRNTCSTEQPEALATRLSEVLSQPYEIYGQHIRIGVSIGIALAPHDGNDPELLLRASDMALYAAKAAGRGNYRFFHKSMAEQLRVKRQLELDLRDAIDNEQLTLHYQPVLSIADKTINGFEALMRWEHPIRGMVPPSEFIPIAEETGLIVTLGTWAIRKACEQATKWPDELSVAVNVSPMQFRNGNLLGTVSDALRETGLSPRRLDLEITETILMQDSDSSVLVLNQLRALGVRISMDDFGTGYSSLSYLRSFPLDKIKIDRAFVKDLGIAAASDVIIRSVIDIATTLKMTTTAEGVETREQLERLAALGCSEAQGYYLSKAVPVSQVPELISKWSTRKPIAA